MDTKSLLIGISSFIAGALLVSIAATTFEKTETTDERKTDMGMMSESMDSAVGSLNDKKGDDFDKAFLSDMIAHHEGAVEIAVLAKSQAKHDEIKKMADDIISAQTSEITQMKQWQTDWNYPAESVRMPGH